MAEFLVKAQEYTHPDPEKDRRGVHKKGDIIVVKPDGHEWGAAEGLPTFVLVKVPGLSVATVENRMESWRWNIQFAINQSNLTTDSFRITATNGNVSTSGQGGLTLSRVQDFLTLWGASVVSNTASSVTFDVSILAAATSQGFWQGSVANISFTQQSYTQATGQHVITVDFSAHPSYVADSEAFTASMAVRAQATGATIVSSSAGQMVVSVDRADVRERFRADLTDRLGVWRRHRYYFTSAQVDTVIGLGGVITRTIAQIQNDVRDRMAE